MFEPGEGFGEVLFEIVVECLLIQFDEGCFFWCFGETEFVDVDWLGLAFDFHAVEFSAQEGIFEELFCGFGDDDGNAVWFCQAFEP